MTGSGPGISVALCVLPPAPFLLLPVSMLPLNMQPRSAVTYTKANILCYNAPVWLEKPFDSPVSLDYVLKAENLSSRCWFSTRTTAPTRCLDGEPAMWRRMWSPASACLGQHVGVRSDTNWLVCATAPQSPARAWTDARAGKWHFGERGGRHDWIGLCAGGLCELKGARIYGQVMWLVTGGLILSCF